LELDERVLGDIEPSLTLHRCDAPRAVRVDVDDSANPFDDFAGDDPRLRVGNGGIQPLGGDDRHFLDEGPTAALSVGHEALDPTGLRAIDVPHDLNAHSNPHAVLLGKHQADGRQARSMKYTS